MLKRLLMRFLDELFNRCPNCHTVKEFVSCVEYDAFECPLCEAHRSEEIPSILRRRK